MCGIVFVHVSVGEDVRGTVCVCTVWDCMCVCVGEHTEYTVCVCVCV